MNSKQGNGRWRRFGRRNSAPDRPIMDVIPSRGATDDLPDLGRGPVSRGLAMASKRRGSMRGSFREAKPYVPTEEISSLTALPPSSVHGRNINVVPEDFPALSSSAGPQPLHPTRTSSSCTADRLSNRSSPASINQRPFCRRNSSKSSSRASYVPPAEGKSPSSTTPERGSPASHKSKNSKSTSSSDKPKSPADGGFEIEVYCKPSSKRLEDHDRDIANFRRKHGEDFTDTTTPMDDFAGGPRTPGINQSDSYAQSSDEQEDQFSLKELTFNESTAELAESRISKACRPTLSGMYQEHDKRTEGKDYRSLVNDSWRTSRTGTSSGTLQTDVGTLASRSHISVLQIEADADSSTRDRSLSQHARWDESTLDLTASSDMGCYSLTVPEEVNWMPPATAVENSASSLGVPPSAQGTGRSTHSWRTNVGDASSHSAVSRSSRRDDMPRKPRHSKCSSPSREVEWKPRVTNDVPPSQSKSGRSGRRSRLSPERVREIEIAWSPEEPNASNRDSTFSSAPNCNDYSPVKPARYWQPPADMAPSDTHGGSSHHKFDRMMKLAIRRSQSES